MSKSRLLVKTSQHPHEEEKFEVKGQSKSFPIMLYTVNVNSGMPVNLVKSLCYISLDTEELKEYIRTYKKIPKL